MRKEESKKQSKILAPQISSELTLAEFEVFKMEDGLSISNFIFEDCSAENVSIEHAVIEKCIFKNVIFQDVSFKNIELTDVRFEHCDLSNADLSGAVIHRTEFINCKMVGINMGDATLRNTLFDNCNGEYSFYRFSDFKQVNFIKAQLNYADFQDCSFTKIGFDETILIQSQMSGTKLKSIDFRTSEIDGMGVRIDDLAGAIVNIMQAATLARLLGIVIKE